MINSRCVNCLSSNIVKFLNSEINPKYLLNKNTLICKNCGLAFKDIKINDKIYQNSIKNNYYSKFDKYALEKRFEARIIFDKTRAKRYYEFILPRIKLRKKMNYLDVGGAEGWFANYIKINHPEFEVYNIDPDINAIKYGRARYPNVKHICSRLEDIDKIKFKKIDILSYWGGFYRTAEPLKTIQKIYKKTSDKANLFLSLPYTFDNPLRQDNTPYGSLDEIIGNGSLLFLNRFYLERLFENSFKIKEKKLVQNFPFKKKIDIFHLQKQVNKKDSIFKYKSKNYYNTVNFLTSYCEKKSISNINKFYKKNKISKIFIWSEEQNLNSINDLFKKTKIKKFYLIKEDTWNFKKNNSIDSIFNFKIDALFIADFAKQNLIEDQLINRLHINHIKIVKLINQKYIGQKIFENYNSKMILKKVFEPYI